MAYFIYCFSGRNFSVLNAMHCKIVYHKCNNISTLFSAAFLRTERLKYQNIKLFL